MTQKLIASIVLFTFIAGCATPPNRKISSVQETANAEFLEEIKKAQAAEDPDFETLFQKALGAGWGFKDSEYFKDFKHVSPPNTVSLPREFKEVQLLVKTTPSKDGFQVTTITTTDKLGKEGKFLATRAIMISNAKSDAFNRMVWEEAMNGLASATMTALDKVNKTEKDADIKKKRHSLKCIVWTWSVTAALAVGTYALMIKSKPTTGSKAGDIATASLFALAVSLNFGYVIVDSICTGAPTPEL